ncbi:RING finger protein 212B-like [Prorops nasuta]|uniref:RING finger protein 212B-like n=1 Tax=Prorops nasuta TaxID=863751 RepID=UPI0034CE08E0
MNFFVCNNCFSPPNRGKNPYFVTECGHIYCSDCISKMVKSCVICRSENPASLPIKDPLIPKIADYFAPVEERLKSEIKTLNFQKAQMRILIKRFGNLDNKYEKIKQKYWLAHRKVQELSVENAELKRVIQNQKHKGLFNELKNSGANFKNDKSERHKREVITPNSERIFLKAPSAYSSTLVTPMQQYTLRDVVTSDSMFRVPHAPPRRSGTTVSTTRSSDSGNYSCSTRTTNT